MSTSIVQPCMNYTQMSEYNLGFYVLSCVSRAYPVLLWFKCFRKVLLQSYLDKLTKLANLGLNHLNKYTDCGYFASISVQGIYSSVFLNTYWQISATL